MGLQKGISVGLKQVGGLLLLIGTLCSIQFWTSDYSVAYLRRTPFYSRDLREGSYHPRTESYVGPLEVESPYPSLPRSPDDRFVIFNVLPKSGSRTLNSLALNVATRHGVNIENTMALTDKNRSQKMTNLLGRGNPTFVYSHMSFQDVRTDRRNVVYISIVRDPIERLVSLYYYKRYGDSTAPGYFRAKMDKLNLSRDSFDECARKNGDCVSSALMTKTIQHFCDGGTKSVKRCISNARENVRNEYLVVGVMDDYLGFIKVLEKLLPDVFRGAEEFYKDFVTQSYFSVMKTKNKTGPSEEVMRMLRKRMVKEYEFYDYVKTEFEILKRKLGIV